MRIANRTDEHAVPSLYHMCKCDSTTRKHLITRLCSKPMYVHLNSPHMSMFMFCVFRHRFLPRLL